MRLLLAFVMWLALLPAAAQSPAPDHGPADLYFVAVGAGNHLDPQFETMKASAWSAEVVARALIDAGARHGLLLASRPGDDVYVTREDFLGALTRLKTRIRQDGSRTPRILVYVMGHGVADPTSGYQFMVPDNLKLQQNPVPQEHVFRLGRRTLFNFDILAALMAFRLDARLDWFDDFSFSSFVFSDRLGLASMGEHFGNIQKLNDEFARRSASYGPKPFDNAPVPFVLMMDNCSNGGRVNLVEPNPFFNQMVGMIFNATLDAGRAFYAVKPGEVAAPLPLPKSLVSDTDKVEVVPGVQGAPFVGPLAVHLKNALRGAGGRALSLEAFAEALSASGPQDAQAKEVFPTAPHANEARLRPDVKDVEFLPEAPANPRGTVEVIAPTGRQAVPCCDRID